MVLIENESENGIFQMYGIDARDLRHPYIPSTTVLGDIGMAQVGSVHSRRESRSYTATYLPKTYTVYKICNSCCCCCRC